MDPKNQQPNQPAQQGQHADMPQQQVQPIQPTIPPSATPQIPVSGPQKEHGPIEAAVNEYIKPTETTPELHPIVKEAGVERAPDTGRVQLTPDHIAAGVQHAKEAIPHPTEPTGAVKYPMTHAQVLHSKKSDPVSSPKRWLAELTEYVMKKLQMPQ